MPHVARMAGSVTLRRSFQTASKWQVRADSVSMRLGCAVGDTGVSARFDMTSDVFSLKPAKITASRITTAKHESNVGADPDVIAKAIKCRSRYPHDAGKIRRFWVDALCFFKESADPAVLTAVA